MLLLKSLGLYNQCQINTKLLYRTYRCIIILLLADMLLVQDSKWAVGTIASGMSMHFPVLL